MVASENWSLPSKKMRKFNFSTGMTRKVKRPSGIHLHTFLPRHWSFSIQMLNSPLGLPSIKDSIMMLILVKRFCLKKISRSWSKSFWNWLGRSFEFQIREVSKSDALAYYEKEHNEFKLELISNLEDGDITFCDHSNFTDLCRGGHLPNTGLIKAVKIMNVAGAYWRGDEKKPQLTRVYGISFPKQSMLKDYLHMLEEAKKRDHRKLGKELELFTFSDKVGQGLPLWLPKGAALRERLENFMRAAQKKAGYEPVVTPHIGHKNLYVTSGHYEKYGEDSFKPIETPHEGEEFFLKPMNCPHHCEIYKASPKSYRDLPVRLAEFGTVYRYEQSGELHGLTRVRGFTQDDAHIFCRVDQVKDEFKKVIDLVLYVFKALDFKNFTAQISLRDPDNLGKYIGDTANWEKAERDIIEATEERGVENRDGIWRGGLLRTLSSTSWWKML